MNSNHTHTHRGLTQRLLLAVLLMMKDALHGFSRHPSVIPVAGLAGRPIELLLGRALVVIHVPADAPEGLVDSLMLLNR